MIVWDMDLKRVRQSLLLLAGIITFGTFGYHFIVGMSLFDSFYMTVITISTVGFSEIAPLGTAGRILTVIIIITGTATLAYTVGNIVKMFVEGELSKTFGRRKVEKQIANLSEHYIICGYGRIGSLICRELKSQGIDFVVIENNLQAIQSLEKDRYYYVAMDATSEEALFKAGIERAKGIVTAVESDADNVYITLTAKGIRPDIYILSRSSDEKSETKLKKAGATRVVTPYLIGGKRMAQVLIRPTVVDFVDIALMDKRLGLSMEEFRIREASGLVGKNLVESNLRKDYGVIIVAISKTDGDMIFNPQPQEVLRSGDIIVLLGKREDLMRMNIDL
ncbi:MAG: potassium channel protein [Spirochaetes bacterium]|nr:MAG: potassium channel protein [Spirochaetota bacterium]